jgi:tetratricopeptide (TPR) repeat protein
MVTVYLRSEIPLLVNGQPDRITNRNLTELVALFRLDMGWMAYDAGQQHVATENFTRALQLAHSTGNRQLGARILAAMSHQAIYLGQLRQAVDFAQAARAATRHTATPRTGAMLAAMQACAHAAAGDAEDCHRALGEAADALTLIRADPEPEDLDFDEGGYWGHAAPRLPRSGRQPEAERCAEKSVGLCLAGHNRTSAPPVRCTFLPGGSAAFGGYPADERRRLRQETGAARRRRGSGNGLSPRATT